MAQASWPTAKATQGPSEPSTPLLAPTSLHLPPLPPLTAGPLSHVYVLLLVSDVSNSATPESAARQAPLSVGFSKQEDWSGLPFPPPGDFPDPGIEPGSPALQAASLPTELQEKPQCVCKGPSKVWSGGQLNYRTSSSEDGLSSSLRTWPVCAHLFPSLHGGNQRAKGPARDDPAGKQQRADSRRTVDPGESAPQVKCRMPQAHPPSVPPVRSGSPTSPATSIQCVVSTCCPGSPSTQPSGPASSHPPSEGPSCDPDSPSSGPGGAGLWDSGLSRSWYHHRVVRYRHTGLGRSPVPVTHLLCDLGELPHLSVC